MRVFQVLLITSLCFVLTAAAHVKFDWVVEQWVVDFMRPTIDLKGGFFPWQKDAERKTPFHIPESQTKSALLVNGRYPGPPVEVYANDTVEITISNKIPDQVISIHWHGLHQPGTPYMDGAYGVTQRPILPGTNFTYTFVAWPPGSHYWHAHMDSVQTERGLRGAFIVKEKEDPYTEMYDEEMTVIVSDEWRDPAVCLNLEGAMPGNDVCADVRHVSFNGQYGNGTDAYPYPLITVKHGKCYRMRFIFPGSNTENLQITVAGHNMTVIAIDGVHVKPLQVTSFNLHLGDRYDVVLCADQKPGNYLINATYDYACNLVEGRFIPPGFSAVPSCSFFAFLNYEGVRDVPRQPIGTGGGAHPQTTYGTPFDLTNYDSWTKTEPVEADDALGEPDVRYTVNMGLLGPTYNEPTDEPLTKGRWYMDLAEHQPPRTFFTPSTPLYETKGAYDTPDIPIIHVPENATVVEIVINNLSPTAHVLHMHGNKFQVVNYANFDWCGLDKISCFVLPFWANKCPIHDRQVGDPKNPNLVLGGYWGCKYNEQKDAKSAFRQNPLRKDMIQVWQRSWAVIRFKATNPGIWLLHCHLTQHIPMGMQMAFNVLPSKQPALPKDFGKPTSIYHTPQENVLVMV